MSLRATPSLRPLRVLCLVAPLLSLTACPDPGSGAPDPTNPTFSIGGTASGLGGETVELTLNAGAPLQVRADGAFVFPTKLDQGASYTVAVGTTPATLVCTLANATGTVG